MFFDNPAQPRLLFSLVPFCWINLFIFESPHLGPPFSHHSSDKNIQWKFLADVRGQRIMGRLVQDDRKARVTQITARYKQGMQNTISERTTHRTLKKMGNSSRRPHRVPFLSANNRKLRLQFTQAHQIWTIEDWKNFAWSDESPILLQHSGGRERTWCK